MNLKFMPILEGETVGKADPRVDISLHLLIMQAQRILPLISTSLLMCPPLYPPPSAQTILQSLLWAIFHDCWDKVDY